MEKEIAILFGQRVRERRLELGYTQEELANLSDLSRSYIGEIETGKRNILLRAQKKSPKYLKLKLLIW